MHLLYTGSDTNQQKMSKNAYVLIRVYSFIQKYMFLFLLLSCLCAGGNKFSKCLFNGKTEFLGNCQYLFLTFVLFSFSKGILQVRFRIFHIGTNELFVSEYV